MVGSNSKKTIVANWKMHKTIEEASLFIEDMRPLATKSAHSVWIAPSFTALSASIAIAKGSNISIGAQNLSQHAEGAYTGEISAAMLKNVGVAFVIIGHSERRHLFFETSAVVQAKTHMALRYGLMPLVCVGENLSDRESGHTKSVLQQQVVESLQGFSPVELSRVMLAYEPVWAIGTGLTATPAQIMEAHLFCKQAIASLFKKAPPRPVLYGGSVNVQNAASILAIKEVDGLLIGGASLQIESFGRIIGLAGS